MEVLPSLAQLERCHRRHDEVMTNLLEAARRFAAGRPDDGDLDRVRDAVAYFERSITRHFLDEEGSVFPRLSTRRPELAAELASLSAEHPAQIEMQAAVAAAVRELETAEERPSAGKTLLDAATRLAEMHAEHVGREDEIFKIAQEALTSEDDAEIVAEMGTRRDRDDGGNGDSRMRGGGGGGGGGSGRRRRQTDDVSQTEMLLEGIQPPREYARPPTVAETPTAKKAKAAVTNGVSKKSAAKAKPKAKAAAKTAAKNKPATKPMAAKKAKPAKATKASKAAAPKRKPTKKAVAKKPAKRR